MDIVQRALGVLSDAEQALRELIEQGLREQRYAEIAHIAGLADGLARLLNHRQETTQYTPTRIPDSAVKPPPAKGPSTKRTTAKVEKNKYPRFERDGDRLVKVGWSKKNQASYEHREPREAVIAFVRHLTSAVPQGSVFVVETLMPIPDLSSKGEIPAYQVYLTLAWLRHIGAVEKKGRDGYVLRPDVITEGTFDKWWAALPVRTP